MLLSYVIDSAETMYTTQAIMFAIGFIGLYIIICLIPANIAKKKGYSFAGFMCFALFFWLPALIVALLINDKNMKDSNDSAEALIKYKQLYDQGVISAEEFNRKKQELL